MSPRFWLDKLPSTDPAFEPLQRAAVWDPEEFAALEQAHKRAVSEAAWGKSLADLDGKAEALRLETVRDCEPMSDRQAEIWRRDELEALGYALGVTAVKVALYEHAEDLAVAS